jgi:hypothetical protein
MQSFPTFLQEVVSRTRTRDRHKATTLPLRKGSLDNKQSQKKNLKMETRQHGYGYVYRYPVDTDTSIHHFLKQFDEWIRLNIFSKNNSVQMRYKIKENKQQYSMRTHFKGFKHDP